MKKNPVIINTFKLYKKVCWLMGVCDLDRLDITLQHIGGSHIGDILHYRSMLLFAAPLT